MLTADSPQGRLILLATILASGMAFLDGTAVTVALPQIQHDLHSSLAGLEWVTNAFTLTLAAFLLASGALGDRYGRKKIFAGGVALFTSASLLCGAAQTIEQLIAARALQGVGGAVMIPSALAIINACFDERARGQAIGIWAGLSAGIGALGPFFGGLLVQTAGWPAIFFVNLPVGLAALLATLRFVPETRNQEAGGMDLPGTVFVSLALSGLAFGLIEGPTQRWEGLPVRGALIGSLVCAVAFVVAERRAAHPLVPLAIFDSPLVAGANLATLFLYSTLAAFFFLVLNLQQVLLYSPLEAGLAMLPSIVIITVLSGPAGALADRIGPRVPMVVGPLLVAAGMALLAVPGQNVSYVRDLLPGLALIGIGFACVVAPLTKSALAVDPRYSGAASGVNNAVSRVAGLVSIALLGAVAHGLFSARLGELVPALPLAAEQQGQILNQADRLAGIEIPAQFDEASRRAASEAVAAAFDYSYRWIMTINAFFAVAAAVVSFTMVRGQPALATGDGAAQRASGAP